MNRASEFDVQTESLQGITLIEASAGTGKTFTLALLVLRLVIESGLEIQEIVAVTFTKAATAELKERVAKFLRFSLALLECTLTPEEVDNKPLCDYIAKIRSTQDEIELKKKIETALLQVDEAAIYTIHGFCQRLLTDFAFESGAEFGREMISDQNELIEEIRNNFWRKEVLSLEPHDYTAITKHIGSPQALHNRVASAINATQIRIEGIVETKPQTAILEQKKSELLHDIRSEWNIHRSAVSSIIAEAKELGILNGTSYKEWIYDLDTLFLSPFETSESMTRAELLTQNGFKPIKGKQAPEHLFFARLETIIPKLEQAIENVSIAQMNLVTWIESRYITFVNTKLTEVKDARNLGSFDDMITGVFNAVSDKNPRRDLFLSLVRNRYGAVLVDEFQDTDSQQFTIFKEIFSPSIFFMIGDPKQAIYKFRGGDVYAYLKARSQPGIREFTLNTNYRSESSLIAGLNHIFAIPQSEPPFLTDGIEYHTIHAGSSRLCISNDTKTKPAIQLWELETPVSGSGSGESISKSRAIAMINRAVASEISQLLANEWTIGNENSRKRVTAKDIAILVSTGREAIDLKDILNAMHIPAVTVKTGALYGSEEAVQLLAILEAVLSPASEKMLRSLFYQRPFSLQLDEIDSSMLEIMSRFTEYHDLWETDGVMAMIHQLFDDEQLYSHLISKENDGYRPLTNFRHLFEQLHTIESEQGIAPLRLTAHLREMIANPSGEEHQQRMENDESAVKLVTIHGSKGLEYPIVFVPYPWTLTYSIAEKSGFKKIVHPVNHRLGETVFNLHAEADMSVAISEYNEEQQRLFYVALTRASQRLYLIHAEYYTSFAKGKEKVDEINPAHRFLKPLRDNPHRSIEFCSLVDIATPVELPTVPFETLKTIRKFEKSISSGDSTKSYSSIMTHPEPIKRERTPVEPKSIFAFPKGARTGNAWHKIFETIDYGQPSDKHIDGIHKSMKEYGFSPDAIDFECIYAMVAATISRKLDNHCGTPFSLRDIDKTKRITEMPFYLRADRGDPSLIRDIIEEYEGFCVSIRPESFHGYLQGFIDLLFENNGKWFVLDWKSNHLGNSTEFYQFEYLTSAMEENEYRLQYILYVVAVTKYLSNTLESFNYDEHIGGAYYVFLRGVNRFGSEGFWFSKPKKKTVELLLRLFLGNERPQM